MSDIFASVGARIWNLEQPIEDRPTSDHTDRSQLVPRTPQSSLARQQRRKNMTVPAEPSTAACAVRIGEREMYRDSCSGSLRRVELIRTRAIT